MIEQLHYTWAESGLQGRGRFQVTAASPGLRDLSGSLARLALRLCRRPGEKSRDAVSFGWIDAREHRFVFRRVPTGRTADGRPGRFAAHILVAPSGVIAAADILQRPGTEHLWWSGEPEANRELPRLDPQPLLMSIEATQVSEERLTPGHDELIQVSTQILAQHAKGKVSATWQALLAVAAKCSATLPEVFEALSSFSTFEDGESAGWFELVGTWPRLQQQPGTTPVDNAARLIVSADSGDLRAARLAAQTTQRLGKMNWPEFIALAAVLHATRSGGQLDQSSLLAALHNSATAGEALQIRSARVQIADALLASRDGVQAALAVSAPGINSNLLRQLGCDIGERQAFTTSPVVDPGAGARERPSGARVDGPDWRAATRAAEPLGRHGLDGLAEAALRAALPPDNAWPGPLLQACLRSPALTETRMTSFTRAVAHSTSLLATLGDREVLASHRAEVAEEALSAGLLSPASFARIGSADWELLISALPRLDEYAVRLVLDALTLADRADAISAVAADLPGVLRLSVCRELVQQLTPARAAGFCASLRHVIWHEHTAEWNTVADTILRALARDQMADAQKPLDPDQLYMACPDDSAGNAWRNLLTMLRKATAYPSRSNLELVAAVLQRAEMLHDIDARTYAVQAILPVLRPRSASTFLADLPGTVDESILGAAISSARRMLTTQQSVWLTLDVVELFACSDLTDGVLKDECAQIARWLDQESWEELGERFCSASPEAQRRLAAICRRAVGRRARLISRIRR